MRVLDLCCAQAHAFEGWFASMEDFERQLAQGLVACPLCGDARITKSLSAPRLNLGATRDPASSAPALQSAAPIEQQARWMRAVRELMARTEDVGERFADEARRMHYGEVQERGIRGQATSEQTEALLDEGIAVLPLPIPLALKEDLH